MGLSLLSHYHPPVARATHSAVCLWRLGGLLIVALVVIGCSADEPTAVDSSFRTPNTRDRGSALADSEEFRTPDDSGGQTTGQQRGDGSSTNPEPQVDRAPDVTIAVGDRLDRQSGSSIQVHGIERDVHVSAPFQPDPGKTYVAADVEGCAVSKASSGINPLLFELVLAGERRPASSVGLREPALLGTELSLGECERGWVTFEVPVGAVVEAVAYSDIEGSIQWTV